MCYVLHELMSKTKKNEAPHYELLYLISNQFSEDELKPIIEKVEKLINDNEGAITLRQSIGKKRLAYKIKQFRHGYYELVEFSAPTTALPKINDQLRLASDILRHQIVKSEPKTPEQLAKEVRVMAELAQAAKEEEGPTSRNTNDAKAKKTEPVAPSAFRDGNKDRADSQNGKAEGDKIALSDLDDKLNQILDTDNLL